MSDRVSIAGWVVLAVVLLSGVCGIFYSVWQLGRLG